MHNVLDDVVDKEAGAKPKLVGQSGGVGLAVRHISQDELDAYVEGRLSGARLDYVRAHLDACEACRAELEDLRTFKANAVGLSQASSLKRELERRKRQRQLKAAATAAVAAAVVAAIGVVGWNKFGKAWVHTTFASATNAARPTAVAAAGDAQPLRVAPAADQSATTASATAQVRDARAAAAQPRATPIASTQSIGAAQSRSGIPAAGAASQQLPQSRGASAAGAASQQLPQSRGASAAGAASQPLAQARGASVAGAASQPLAQARGASVAGAASQPLAQARGASAAGTRASATVQPTVAAVAAASSAPQLSAQARGAAPTALAPGSTSFALLGPFGDEVSDDRPEFAWQPLEGATKYAIIIVDEGLRPIAHTRLKTTSWRPHKPLRRGRTYLWQVTAILKNGTKVMATGPASQEARIHITAPSK
jgi:anti-sigma factor RsiW